MSNSSRWPIAGVGRSHVLRSGLVPLIAAAAMVWACPVFADQTQTSNASIESQVLTLEKGFNDAYAHNDLPRYFSYYAEDFRGLFPNGVFGKAAYMKDWTAYIKAGNKIVDFTWSDMVVTVSSSGDAAVASYHAVATTKEPGKAQAAEKYGETDVWFKRKGSFQLVVVQYSDTGHAP